MIPVFDQLKQRERDREDADDAAVDALADVYSTEQVLEDCIRNLDGAASQADRASSGLRAQRTIFPEGYGVEIKPEGQAQLLALTPLRVRFQPFVAGNAGIGAAVTALDTAEAAFRAALEARTAADGDAERLFAEEREARRAVRQQIESAHGRLCDYYKAKPALAERYFLNAAVTRAKKPGDKPGDKPAPEPPSPPTKPTTTSSGKGALSVVRAPVASTMGATR
ncbi:hypothetical protein [Chondromyces apiculatus]|nr:hypothetical protein [Chondromyces apiculatus]